MPACWNPLFDRNLLDAIRKFARWPDGTLILEEDGVLFVLGGTDFPVGFTNCVARTEASSSPALVLERAAEFFGPQSRGYTIWVRAHADTDIEALLQARGKRPRTESPWLFLDRRPATPTLPGVEVRLTADPSDPVSIRDVAAEAFAQAGTPQEETAQLFTHAHRVFSPISRFALATIDGEPAAAAMVLLTGGMGGIYGVATRPKFARRGLETACTAAVANAAFDLGKPMVGLHATPMGRTVYERLGFEPSPSGHRWYVMP